MLEPDCFLRYHGSEMWTMLKVDSDRIQSFHMQALRRILGIRWYDKVPNAVVDIGEGAWRGVWVKLSPCVLPVYI